ncbi:MAG: peptide chain release factor N(5)-glutamine methyltransferase [Planctomycetes bacterium]|nr:peptide chain release factor N(5)-glutamine methyltransferase [Planctomycetota bacterium]
MTLDDLAARLRERLRGQVDSPALEAELLVSAAAGFPRERLIVRGREVASSAVVAQACHLAVRRLAGEPVALLLGARDFFGRTFRVIPGVLVPRPDSETLIEAALAAGVAGRIADVGCGSGILGVTLAAERPAVRTVVALDLSPYALHCTRENAARHGVASRLQLVRSDLLTGLAPAARFDAIVANPPYVEPLDWPGLPSEIVKYEPWFALTPGFESAAAFRARLIAQACERLRPGGWLAIEVGAGQAGVARDQFRAAGLRDVAIHNDLGSIGRIVSGRQG